MFDLFKSKYRIPSARLQTWDYANEGMYFITICTKNMECFFGEIVETPCMASLKKPDTVETQCVASNQKPDGQETPCMASLRATEIGKIAEMEWYKTVELRPDMNLEMAEFVVMPNHIHGIIAIGENEFNSVTRRDAMHRVSTNKFGPQKKNIASIIRGYKSAVTNYANKNNVSFAWQPRFHDHVIRTIDEYAKISNYILNNPTKWLEDKFYKP